jgi:hypothetical protein
LACLLGRVLMIRFHGQITWAIGWALLKPQAAAGSAKL